METLTAMNAETRYPTLEHVARDAGAYPVELVEDADSALILFAAAFMGRNDAIHFATEGVRDVTLVDIDAGRLELMRALYRDDDWVWRAGDAWEVARELAEAGRKFDVVSVDTFTGEAEEKSLGSLGLWTSLANDAVVVTASSDSAYRAPAGWSTRIVWRSLHVYWLVLEDARS